MSEKEYDDEIAPALLKLANRCKELGMPFTATVEYEMGKRGTTAAAIGENNLDMLVPYWAGRTGSRMDDLILAVARKITDLKMPHSCICLERFVPPDPKNREDQR